MISEDVTTTAGCAPVSDVQDAEELLDTAGRRGDLLWRFRPVRGGMWEEVNEDASLEPGGYRNPPCPRISCEFGELAGQFFPGRSAPFELGRRTAWILASRPIFARSHDLVSGKE